MKRKDLKVGMACAWQPTELWTYRVFVVAVEPWVRGKVPHPRRVWQSVSVIMPGKPGGKGVALAVPAHGRSVKWAPTLGFLRHLRPYEEHEAEEKARIDLEDSEKERRKDSRSFFKGVLEVLLHFGVLESFDPDADIRLDERCVKVTMSPEQFYALAASATEPKEDL